MASILNWPHLFKCARKQIDDNLNETENLNKATPIEYSDAKRENKKRNNTIDFRSIKSNAVYAKEGGSTFANAI